MTLEEDTNETEYECSAGEPCPFCDLPMDKFAHRQLCSGCEIEYWRSEDSAAYSTMPTVKPEISWRNGRTYVYGEGESIIILMGYVPLQRLLDMKAFI